MSITRTLKRHMGRLLGKKTLAVALVGLGALALSGAAEAVNYGTQDSSQNWVWTLDSTLAVTSGARMTINFNSDDDFYAGYSAGSGTLLTTLSP